MITIHKENTSARIIIKPFKFKSYTLGYFIYSTLRWLLVSTDIFLPLLVSCVRRHYGIVNIDGPNMLTFEASCHSAGISLDLMRGKVLFSSTEYEVRIQHGTRPRIYLRPCRCDRYDNYAILGEFRINATQVVFHEEDTAGNNTTRQS